MLIKSVLRKLFHKVGYDLVRLGAHSAAEPTTAAHEAVVQRMRLIKHYGIDLVFDVGANTGQYGAELRAHGYQGRIVSFEPVRSAFLELEKKALRDSLWEKLPVALGSESGDMEINVAGNSYMSSSLLDMLPKHTEAAPYAAYVSSETVSVRTLDSLFDNYYSPNDKVYLKIDAQGYGKNILEGATQSLNKVMGIQLELSLVPLYAGEALFMEMMSYLLNKGYLLMAVEPVFNDPLTGQSLQFDGVFFRA